MTGGLCSVLHSLNSWFDQVENSHRHGFARLEFLLQKRMNPYIFPLITIDSIYLQGSKLCFFQLSGMSRCLTYYLVILKLSSSLDNDYLQSRKCYLTNLNPYNFLLDRRVFVLTMIETYRKTLVDILRIKLQITAILRPV